MEWQEELAGGEGGSSWGLLGPGTPGTLGGSLPGGGVQSPAQGSWEAAPQVWPERREGLRCPSVAWACAGWDKCPSATSPGFGAYGSVTRGIPPEPACPELQLDVPGHQVLRAGPGGVWVRLLPAHRVVLVTSPPCALSWALPAFLPCEVPLQA